MASAEIDGDKFGLTTQGTMSSACIALHIFLTLSPSWPVVTEASVQALADEFTAQSIFEGVSSDFTVFPSNITNTNAAPTAWQS